MYSISLLLKNYIMLSMNYQRFYFHYVQRNILSVKLVYKHLIQGVQV
jgi:hypothetical protein